MSRVITYSQVYPVYHPKKGQPTNFVGKVLNSIDKNNHWFAKCDKCGWMGSSGAMEGGGQIADTGDYDDVCCPKCRSKELTELDDFMDTYYLGKFTPKHHTIRAGNRWKVGMYFSPRVWSGKPYQSKQITLAPDVEIKQVWKFEIKCEQKGEHGFYINGTMVSESSERNGNWFNKGIIDEISKNDGLDVVDFLNWFKFPSNFSGQIICWNNDVKY